MDEDRKERVQAHIGTLDNVEQGSEELSGKRAASVSIIIDCLLEAGEGVPLSSQFLLEEAESDVSQMGPCFLALELVGVTQRHTYDSGGRKPGTAYSIRDGVMEND